MGLSIRDIIPRKEIEIEDLKGKVICVDAFNALYQFLSTIRQPDGTPLMDSEERITSHLSGVFYRNINLMNSGVKLVYVFDGIPPELKRKIHRKRKEVRDLAEERYESARSEEDFGKMKSYSSQMVRLNDGMISESKELLEAMGIAVIQAPGEGEAEAAYLCHVKKSVYASASQDYDSLLFGADKLVRNLTLSRRRKTFNGYVEVKPEIIDLEKVLNYHEINLDQLICLGILVGTDYNPKGVPGIGQKKALDIVKKYKYPVEVFKHVEVRINDLPDEDKFDWKEIYELFHKADVRDFEIKFPKVDEDKIKEILVERHEFSEERVEKQINRLKEFLEKAKQVDLEKWF